MSEERTEDKKLLSPKAGYVQDASPIQPNTTPILNLLIHMKNNNKADSTINFTRKALIFLSKHTSLNEPEAVKQFIAQMEAKDGYKHNLCVSYNRFCDYYQIQWQMPVYRNEEREIVPPKKDKILMLIAEAHKATSTKIQLSMETGLRPIELCRLLVKHVDLEHNTINLSQLKEAAQEHSPSPSALPKEYTNE
jgi:integrase